MAGQIILNQKELILAPSTRFWTKTARCITNLTAPPFLTIPAFVAFGQRSPEQRGAGLGTSLGMLLALFFGLVLPVLIMIILKLCRLITDFHVTDRKQRTIPYLCASGSYLLGAGVLWQISETGNLAAVLVCYATTTLAVMVITFRWKISAHGTGVGGLLAAFSLLAGWGAAPLFLLLPLVGWARLYLKAHSLGQVIAGSLLGYSAVMFQLIFFSGWIPGLY